MVDERRFDPFVKHQRNMITKEDILKMVTNVSRRSRNIPDSRLIHPEREWSLAIIVFVLLLIGIFTLNAKRFAYFNDIEGQLSDDASSAVEYKYGTMREVLNSYGERTFRFQELRQGIGVGAISTETPAPPETAGTNSANQSGGEPNVSVE